MHRTFIAARGNFRFRPAGVGQGFIAAHSDICIELTIDLFDAVQVGFSSLNGRHLPAFDQAAKFSCSEEWYLLAIHHFPL